MVGVVAALTGEAVAELTAGFKSLLDSEYDSPLGLGVGLTEGVGKSLSFVFSENKLSILRRVLGNKDVDRVFSAVLDELVGMVIGAEDCAGLGLKTTFELMAKLCWTGCSGGSSDSGLARTCTLFTLVITKFSRRIHGL